MRQIKYKIIENRKGKGIMNTWYDVWYHKPSIFNADRWLKVNRSFMTLVEAEQYAESEFSPIVSRIVKESV